MESLLGWLLIFFFLISLMAILTHQLKWLADLGFDYTNQYDSTYWVNLFVLPEFITQAALLIVLLVWGHWFMFLLSLPYLFYNVRLYQRRLHLVHVADIYSRLNEEKNQRIAKLAYTVIILVNSLFWLVHGLPDE